MSDESSNSGDLFGIKPYGEAIKIATEKSLNAAGELLGAICIPAAEELGLMLREKVQFYRLMNLEKILSKANRKIDYDYVTKTFMRVNPRVGLELIENGSKEAHDSIQDYWAGLLASSLSPNGEDESGLLYINILKQMTGPEVLILNYVISKSTIIKDCKSQLITAKRLSLTLKELIDITGIDCIHELDRTLDHMRSIELSSQDSGFAIGSDTEVLSIQATPLSLNLYVRCQGSSKDPIAYFNL